MTTIIIAALTLVTLLYVLWPLLRRPVREERPADLSLEHLEATAREGER